MSTYDAQSPLPSQDVQEEYRPWTRMFPEEFSRQIYRIHGWPYKPGNAKRTPFCGHLINTYVYGELPPGVLDELRRLSPVTERGYRSKHFQFLAADTGNEHLDRQIMTVITLMRISANGLQRLRMGRGEGRAWLGVSARNGPSVPANPRFPGPRRPWT